MVLVSVAEGAGNHWCCRINRAIILYYAAFRLRCVKKLLVLTLVQLLTKAWFRAPNMTRYSGEQRMKAVVSIPCEGLLCSEAGSAVDAQRALCVCVWGREAHTLCALAVPALTSRRLSCNTSKNQHAHTRLCCQCRAIDEWIFKVQNENECK